MPDKPKEQTVRVQLPDGSFELSYNGAPKVIGPTMNAAGQTPPSGKVSASPPPPPRK